MWPSASSATSSCSSVSGRSWTAWAMLSAIRRAVAANASDSRAGTGPARPVLSDASTVLLSPPLDLACSRVEHGVGDLLLACARDPQLAVRGHDHDLVGVGIEADVVA